MSKKRNKDEWKSFVNRTLSRGRSDRRYKLPTDYISSVADKIHKTNPSADIISNIVTEVYEVAFERGYQRRMSDSTYFKCKQEKHVSDDWNKMKDSIEDEIHSK